MTSASFHFDRFWLDPQDRRLTRDGVSVELNARYLDALVLLVREQGKLVSKDCFMTEVWRGVPVTDEALTQCIKTLRRQLGDDARNPSFIETVSGHGYRFIAPVESGSMGPQSAPQVRPAPARTTRPQTFWYLSGAGMAGGGFAGMLGGMFYGFAMSEGSPELGMGAASAVLVLLFLTIMIGLIAGAGVGSGITAARQFRGPDWLMSLTGGAVGGLVVGAIVKLVGLDAFSLLFGLAPTDMTGAGEGVLLGGAVGIADHVARRGHSLKLRWSLAAGAVAGGAAGLLIYAAGGRLMGGSLDLLAQSFPGSRLSMDQIGTLFGEYGFGPISQAVTIGIEGALFGACVITAMTLVRRHLHSVA